MVLEYVHKHGFWLFLAEPIWWYDGWNVICYGIGLRRYIELRSDGFKIKHIITMREFPLSYDFVVLISKLYGSLVHHIHQCGTYIATWLEGYFVLAYQSIFGIIIGGGG